VRGEREIRKSYIGGLGIYMLARRLGRLGRLLGEATDDDGGRAALGVARMARSSWSNRPDLRRIITTGAGNRQQATGTKASGTGTGAAYG